MLNRSCPVCVHTDLEIFDLPFQSLVRSDCRPLQAEKNLLQCGACGLVWSELSIPDDFYQDYDLDEELSGQEQPLFSPDFEGPQPRSRLLLHYLKQSGLLPDSGKSLDIGCNHGFFSAELQALRPHWQVFGFEPLNRPSALRERHIPAEQFFHGSLASIPEHYDLISLIHVLEHLVAPEPVLEALKPLMTSESLLLIQVPDYTHTLFDLVIYDHLFHYTAHSLKLLLEKLGFEVLHLEHFLPKEITLLCRKSEKTRASELIREPVLRLESCIQELRALHQRVLNFEDLAAQANSHFSLMGTAIAACCVSGLLRHPPEFYLEESLEKKEGQFLGRPVYNLPMLQAKEYMNGYLFLPFPQNQAVRLTSRLQKSLPGWKIEF
ncbi:hypothetical protein COW36_18945 [bacterium (Candidatus Blackallbacteria) CG17_big_fil_post_rev_8_21_14_2_50_48_46]|uniref:Methyltransferase n=1 Tax=bacterium (Candidatus Blackallbacteria) CG17_big_fil_post_rev_8_21_14_2_50_48_46 TaxID=2014261 RepID=A0A2M7G0K4_9BACT|nr:MAG: hypothetical protein COW64_25525 [bacterium (Candidatus Blackallbacteria) CG18_big_fil_WC_8_21_14_2_50_49_26]PIW15005.1 MAG: hypothetical protein COW36_18945 [bacterium (Candidatus Blackallbacteria) CG17_big_fil_post_rev_8_21_14_2_50_48_46]PIW50086.1 MAG: hypothetical protein COW20_03880 [bacterium (Candidatus Blackallbacteria) CG13_big_fil_rev_8_21_14_2_50_49_14]